MMCALRVVACVLVKVVCDYRLQEMEGRVNKRMGVGIEVEGTFFRLLFRVAIPFPTERVVALWVAGTCLLCYFCEPPLGRQNKN